MPNRQFVDMTCIKGFERYDVLFTPWSIRIQDKMGIALRTGRFAVDLVLVFSR